MAKELHKSITVSVWHGMLSAVLSVACCHVARSMSLHITASICHQVALYYCIIVKLDQCVHYACIECLQLLLHNDARVRCSRVQSNPASWCTKCWAWFDVTLQEWKKWCGSFQGLKWIRGSCLSQLSTVSNLEMRTGSTSTVKLLLIFESGFFCSWCCGFIICRLHPKQVQVKATSIATISIIIVS